MRSTRPISSLDSLSLLCRRDVHLMGYGNKVDYSYIAAGRYITVRRTLKRVGSDSGGGSCSILFLKMAEIHR